LLLLREPVPLSHPLLLSFHCFFLYHFTCQVARERVPGGWPNDKLAVAAEAPSLLYDILNAEPAIAKGFSQGCRWIRTGLASSEVVQGLKPAGPRVTFVLVLPPVEKADEISMLLVSQGVGSK
jgi:hypothetical protein